MRSCCELIPVIGLAVNLIAGDSVITTKLLIPHPSAGAVLGKRGEVIASLQQMYGANIKLSEFGDFYPGRYLGING